VFENRVLRRIFGPKRFKIIGGWRKIHNDELRTFHYSPNIIRIIKSKRTRWAENVTSMGEQKHVYRFPQ
jgi:hypothetical protein